MPRERRAISIILAGLVAAAAWGCASSPPAEGDPEVRKEALRGAPPDPPPDQLDEIQRERQRTTRFR